MRYNTSVVNVLPTKDLHRVVWEHRRRVAVVVLIFLACSMVLALLFAVPSAIVVWSAAGGFDDQLTATKTLVDLQRKQGGGDVLNDIQERADLLEAVLVQRTPTSILEDIVPRIPSGVSVKQFAYSFDAPVAVGEAAVTVSVLGTAATRNALITFGDNLRQSPLFSRVEVPVSSLAKSEDIDFSLTLSLDEPVSLDAYVETSVVRESGEEVSQTENTATTTPAQDI